MDNLLCFGFSVFSIYFIIFVCFLYLSSSSTNVVFKLWLDSKIRILLSPCVATNLPAQIKETNVFLKENLCLWLSLWLWHRGRGHQEEGGEQGEQQQGEHGVDWREAQQGLAGHALTNSLAGHSQISSLAGQASPGPSRALQTCPGFGGRQYIWWTRPKQSVPNSWN